MSSTQTVILLLIFVLAAALIAVGRIAARRGAARAQKVARELGLPEHEPLTALPEELPPEGAIPAPEALPETVTRAQPRLRDRLAKTRAALRFDALRGRGRLDEDTWDELEEALVLADVGLATTTRALEAVKERAKTGHADDADAVLALLKEQLVAELGGPERSLALTRGEPNVWMFVGVNGVGKTTTIAKLAQRAVADGHKVVLAAADTFRAAAAEQLGLWAERVGADLVRGQEGADPGSVVFDAISAASSRAADLVLVDTAGRLHTKVNLMEELKKLRRIVDRTPGALKEVLLVVDATTGQNGLAQARQFTDAVAVTGVVLTKLDGTAKGGIVLAIQAELGIPVKVVGLGETADDLVPFDPVEFVDALFA